MWNSTCALNLNVIFPNSELSFMMLAQIVVSGNGAHLCCKTRWGTLNFIKLHHNSINDCITRPLSGLCEISSYFIRDIIWSVFFLGDPTVVSQKILWHDVTSAVFVKSVTHTKKQQYWSKIWRYIANICFYLLFNFPRRTYWFDYHLVLRLMKNKAARLRKQ